MKARKVTKYRVTIEIDHDDLYTIFHSLNTYVEQYEILDKSLIVKPKEDIDRVLEEFTNLLAETTDDQGELIPSE